MKTSDVSKPIIRFNTLEGMDHVRLVTGKGVTGSFPRHVHASLCVGIVDRGVRYIETVDGQKALVRPGEIFVLNPGQAHACTCGGSLDATSTSETMAGHDYRVLSLGSRVVGEPALPSGESDPPLPGPARIVFRDTSLARALDALFAASSESHETRDHAKLLQKVLDRLHLLGAAAPPIPSFRTRPHQNGLSRVRRYLDVHCCDKVCLGDLAAIADMSPFHLQRQFSRNIGVSPKNYLLQCRAARAAELLNQGMEPAQVAAFTGFADQSHLTKTFKRFVGTTPARFRTFQAKIRKNMFT